MNFYQLAIDTMNEKGKTIRDLENNNILSKNVFYKFKKQDPSVETLIKISNFLQVSIDYLLGYTTENNFKPYKLPQNNFYNIVSKFLNEYNISKLKFCNDLKISRTNFSRWKRNTMPSLDKIIQITKYLNILPSDIFEIE